MSRARWLQTAQRWSVTALGGLLLTVAGAWTYLDDDRFLFDILEMGFPAAVGVGLVIGGGWLSRACSARRVARIAGWTIASAVFGIAIKIWFGFIISLEATPPGEAPALSINGAAIMMAAGALVGYYATGIREHEQALEVSESRFRALTEHAPFAVITIDEDSTVQYANDAVDELFGYAPEELVGTSVTRVLPERLHDDHHDRRERFAAATEVLNEQSGLELTGKTAGGEEFPIQIAFGRYTVNGEQLFTGIIQDISDRKTAEERLEKYTDRVTRLHNLAVELTRTDTREELYQQTVSGATRLFDCEGARLSVVEGEQLVPIVSTDGETAAMEDSASVPVQAARRARQSTEVVRVDDLTDTRSAGGSVAESSTTASVQAHDKTAEAPSAEPYRSLLTVPLEGHRVLQLFAVEPGAFTDRDEDVAEMLATHVTTAVERVEAQAEIRRERDRLDEFATVLSHDIRNPLNVAMGSVQVVQDAEAEAAEEYLGTVETALERIRRLVDDMLTLAQEGETVDDPERVSLERIAEEAWANVATGEVTMRVQVQKSVEADRDRLMQVFENLYRNAIEHGGEDVTVIVGGLEGGFFVEDTGPGIPPEQRDSVFESGYSTADEGTGFGLAIVKRIVTAHGWQIAVATGDEGGARFEIAGIRSVTRD